MKKFVFYLLCFFACITQANSQSVDNQLWMNYAATIFVNEKLTYGGDIGVRGVISNQEWNQILIRPTVSYRINSVFGIAGAIATFNTFNKEYPNVNEFRLHQDFTASWPDLGAVAFSYRFRFEQRWFFIDGQDEFNLRYRFLIGMDTQDFYWFGERPIYFQAIWEGFKTSGQDAVEVFFLNNRRIHLAFGHRLTDKFRYEFHYINQGSRVNLGESFNTTQHIYRLRFYQRFN